MAGALDGIRVIDFGQYIAGPLAAVMLGDQGADVIHLDPPGGPRWQHPAEAFLNRGKRRITLDLKTAAGVATAQRLIDSADVVIENFRPGVMDRLGLGVDAMTRRNPGLIYCTIPGFAAADPRAGMRAWEGIQVIDLCIALAGPTCGRLLHECGAEVIKVQPPHAGVGGYLNRGKRSLLLDLRAAGAQQVFWRMVETADIVLENFVPGTADRLGIGYEEVCARRPDMVYTSISCYGQIGPWRGRRGWERQGQAVAGIMQRTGTIPAILGPYNLVDIGTGVLATFATALGIYHRLRSGQGQHVHASLCQTATYHQTPYMLDYAGVVANEPRGYGALGTSHLNRFYRAQDRWFFVAARPAEASRLYAIAGLHADGVDRLEVCQQERTLEEALARAPASVWVERLRQGGIAAHAKVTVAELMVDPFVRARGLSVTQPVEGAGDATMPGLSVHLARTPMRLGDCCHRPGSDGLALLAELGLADRLEELEKSWVVRTRDLPPAWRE